MKRLEQLHVQSGKSNIASSNMQTKLQSHSALSSSLMQDSLFSKAKKMKVISVTRTKIDSKEVSKYLRRRDLVRSNQFISKNSNDLLIDQSQSVGKWDSKDLNVHSGNAERSFIDYMNVELGKEGEKSASTMEDPSNSPQAKNANLPPPSTYIQKIEVNNNEANSTMRKSHDYKQGQSMSRKFRMSQNETSLKRLNQLKNATQQLQQHSQIIQKAINMSVDMNEGDYVLLSNRHHKNNRSSRMGSADFVQDSSQNLSRKRLDYPDAQIFAKDIRRSGQQNRFSGYPQTSYHSQGMLSPSMEGILNKNVDGISSYDLLGNTASELSKQTHTKKVYLPLPYDMLRLNHDRHSSGVNSQKSKRRDTLIKQKQIYAAKSNIQRRNEKQFQNVMQKNHHVGGESQLDMSTKVLS